MFDLSSARVAVRVTSPWVSPFAGFLAGLGIAGCPLGGLVTPVVFALWLRGASRSSRIGPWLRQHAALGLFAALGSGTWLAPALVSLGTSPPAAWLTAVGLASWHGTLPFALIALLSQRTRRARPGLQVAGYAAAVFAVETLVSRSGLFIPWVLLGHSQTACAPLTPLATLAGVPAISAALAGLAAISARARMSALGSSRTNHPRVGRARLAIAIALAVLVFAALARLAPRILEGVPAVGQDESLRVLAVQPNFPISGRWDPALQSVHANRIGHYSWLALDAREPRPDLLLWPENSVTWGPDASDPRRIVDDWAARLDVALIAGLAVRDASPASGAYRNLLVWFGRDGGILDSVDKEIGVPGVESAPAESWWSAPSRTLLGRAGAGAKLTTRDGTRSLAADGTITQVLCFEALFPGLVARRRTPATLLLLNPSDDRWAAKASPRASRQLARYASFRAVEQQLPLVRVGHAGGTVLYDARGREVDALSPDTFGALAFTVDRSVALGQARLGVAVAALSGTLAACLVARLPARGSARTSPCSLRHTRTPGARVPEAGGELVDRGPRA